ncbi:MAG: CmcJ/NvfI family oxidoreductase [Pseudomonadota bacterium]
MSSTAEQLDGGENTTGIFNYMVEETESSLYRNSKVLSRRDADGSDNDGVGLDFKEREMVVHDARVLPANQQRTLKAHGFELVDRPLNDPDLDFFDHSSVIHDYYGQCAKLVSEFTGGRAYAFDHNVRSATGKQSKRRISGGQQVQGPAHIAHGDYTLYSAPQRLKDLAQPPGGNDTLKSILAEGETLITSEDVQRCLASGGRFAIINVWRNIDVEPVATHPIAFCDGQTVLTEDLVVFEIHYANRIGENYFSKHADRHRWYYYPAITKEEALLIKQWDSDGPLAQSDGAEADSANLEAPCTFSFHSAFADPATPPDAPDRWSIEVRCIVIYD